MDTKMKILNWLLPPLLLLQCIQGTSTTTLGKYINTACRSVSDCGLDNYLQCINGFCQCDNFNQIYDQSTHKCLLLIGQTCDWSNPNGIKCVPHADCNKSTCRCKPGYRSSTDLICKPDYGSPCHVKDDCDENQGLICSQGICNCFNSTWTYQGHFGCVDPNSSQFTEMMTLLNQTQRLLKDNNLEIRDMFNDLGLQNDPNSEFIFGNMLAEARQFQDTYNTNDLQFAAQNQNSQQEGGSGLNFGQLFKLFQNFQGLLGNRNGGGFLRNLFGGGSGSQGGYPESKPPPPAGGYGAPGQPEGMQGQRFKLINSFLNLFNQMIPIVRQLKMRFSPVRFLQNFLNRFSTTTAAPAPAPAEIHNAPPTVIQSSGNFQPNPIFTNNQQTSEQATNNQGEGTFRFIMRTRERFRNLLRGNQNQGGGGGYDYTPAKPPDQYGAPPAEAAAPASEAPQEAGAAQQNYYTSHNQAPQRNSFNTQPQQHAATNTYNTIPSSPVQGQTIPAQRQQSFGSQSFNSGQHNPQSFFNQGQQHDQHQQNFNNHQQQHVQQPQHQQQAQQSQHQQVQQPHHQQQQHQQQHHKPQQQLNNNHFNHNFNAQATSHQQTTFVPHPQPQTYLNSHQQPAQSQATFAFTNSRSPIPGPGQTTASSIPTLPLPPIPQFKLQLQSQKPAQLPHEVLAQNFILSEADDPHPGFTPHSTPPPATTPQGSFRTAARFERIDDPNSHNTDTTIANTAQQNWRDSF